MPPCGAHHMADLLNVVIRYLVVEEVAHRVDKNLLWRRPPDGVAQFFGYQSQVEAELKGMPLYATESFGERLGITMLTSGADFRAAPDRVPSGVRPLDFGIKAHVSKK